MALVKITHKGLNIMRFAGRIKQFLKTQQLPPKLTGVSSVTAWTARLCLLLIGWLGICIPTRAIFPLKLINKLIYRRFLY